ncbi:MAG: GMP synthase (glutamine-hydrolyzing) [Chlamydiales bacterium]|jgi:GMP synthase (glutamine-hydrolysing)
MLIYIFLICLTLQIVCFSFLVVGLETAAPSKTEEEFITQDSKVLVMDFGSQYTQLIVRRAREQGIYSAIFPCNASLERVKNFSPSAVVLSGGPSSVLDVNSPKLDAGVLEYCWEHKIAILGICYGMQYLLKEFGGEIAKAETREYGKMPIHLNGESTLFSSLGLKTFNTWMSHGDEAQELPPGFIVAAKSASGTIVAAENPESHIYLLQFHPEVTHTENGKEILEHFFQKVANIKPSWSMKSFAQEQIKKIRETVPEGEHVICALSGGVDSCVAAQLVHQAIGDRLHCVFVDNGLLRYNEGERVMKMFTDYLHLPVTKVDASEIFLGNLEGVTDPEKKRKIIGANFISVFENFSKKLEHTLDKKIKFLVQGTLYPDVIESSPSGAHSFSSVIKSHHNVGGLPQDMKFSLIEPLNKLFKDEVRLLGEELSVPKEFLNRHPFPGPGLAVRIIGEITRENIHILQLADEEYINALQEDDLYDKIWQAGAIFLPIRTVGVQGDSRTHAHVIALRAVTSMDGMTADWYPFDGEFLAKVSNRILNKVPGVNRVVYDVSSKPPATIEWE